jgi:hypothetical protein
LLTESKVEGKLLVYKIYVLIGIQALQAQASDFERIFHAIAAPATGRWCGLRIWMETHPNYEPWGVLIERNGDLVAAAILTRYYRFGLWHIGKPHCICDPLCFGALDDNAGVKLAQEIYGAIRSFGGPWKMEISGLPYPDTLINHLRSASPYSQTQLERPLPYLLFAPGVPLSTYLSRNTRAAVAKARNRIKREAIKIVQEWIYDRKRILELLPQIQDICRRRDYQLYQKSLMDDPVEESYWVAFITEYVHQGLINLLTIHLEDELAAFALCLADNGECWVLTNRASPEWLRYSPGTIANAEVVRHAFEDTHSCGVNWGGGGCNDIN